MEEHVHRSLRWAAEHMALAETLEAHAGQLESVFKGVPLTTGESGPYWTGPAASRFADQAKQLDGGLDELIESCRATARNLRRRAEQLRTSAARTPI
ncbi:hypothetical protein Aph01nite_46480 [Acrocarpospora phusangensis]|uniref:Uncharacterized protein n=1 Tax=Acrocarpospora phusangensis TaxID=1070424 RepID=A0A919QF29_9ACTN|nr:hypothetical protein [Acrocarpospora phusangensis]GIH26338.1 hypothetical protein Aph01nite_46480 [Acrocarpospora phusangensis]